MNSYGIIFIIMTTFANEIVDLNKTSVLVGSGDRPKPAIIGGRKAPIEEFPYLARIYSIIGLNAKSCTSAFIKDLFVLTAAHCMYGRKENMKVVAGAGDHNDFIKGLNPGKYVVYKVFKVHAHPNYNSLTFEHDIAILELEKPVSHPGYKLLPLSFEPIKTTMKGKICGWGKTPQDENNNELFAKDVEVAMCTRRVYDAYKFVCLKEPGIMFGDSGGPLIIEEKVWGVCSHKLTVAVSDGPTTVKNFYVSLWQEKEFLESVLKNCSGLNCNHFFLFFILLPLFLIFKNS